MKKHIIILLLGLGFFSGAFAQSAIAKLKYESAEESYSKGDLAVALTKLDEAEKLIGRPNATTSYLRITIQDKLMTVGKSADTTLLAQALNNSAIFLKNYDKLTGVEDKYRDIFKLNEKFIEMANVRALENMPEYKQALQFNKDRNYAAALPLLQKAINKNNYLACYLMAVAYIYGHGVTKDYKAAMYWYRKASDKGHAQSTTDIGDIYRMGLGVPVDNTEALKWYTKAADMGLGEAMSSIGLLYLTDAQMRDYNLALSWYKKAAANGFLSAYYRVADMYLKGQGVPQSNAEMLKWYTLAVESGSDYALYRIGELYFNGTGVTQNFTEAINWYKKGVERGDISAIGRLAALYYDGKYVQKDREQAIALYRKAAGQGGLIAMVKLGDLYAGKDPGITRDDTEAFNWYKKAADLGWRTAMYFTAACYENGRGVKADLAQALSWYKASAEKGYTDAYKKLADMYQSGSGVPKDKIIAAEWKAKYDAATTK